MAGMMRGCFRAAASVLAAVLAGFAPAAAAPPSPVAADKPNILLITIDTLRPDHLGCYGDKAVQTPAIDALAARGGLFTRAFAHTPSTLPSHASILLGRTPNGHGVHDNSNFIVRGNLDSLAAWLKARGYATAAFVGAFPLDSRFGLTAGFDVYDDSYGTQGTRAETFVERPASAVVAKALAWLRNRPAPWFAWIHCFDPHQPYDPPEPFRTRYAANPYDGEIASVDAALGSLFADLAARGLDRRTAVVLTADHGESLGEHGEATHGYFAYNATLHVPLIVALPGGKPARVSADVSHIDIFPTIADILGQPAPQGLWGRSLLPLLRGRSVPDRPIYFEALTAFYNRGWAPLRGFILGDRKYMDSPIPEVYDLAKDFGETDNIAAAASLAPLRKAFSALVDEESAGAPGAAPRAPDRETAEKLRSLGYLASPQAPPTRTFTPADDLKTLLPFHRKWAEATAAWHAGRAEEGIRLLQEIIAERKDFDLAYTYLADFYQDLRQPDRSLAVLKDALDHNPESARILNAYAIRLINRGRYDEAAPLLRKSLSLIDFDPETWNYLGVSRWGTGAFDEAQAAYEKALSLDANDAMAVANIAVVDLSRFMKAGGAEWRVRAVEGFRKALTLDPRYSPAWNGLGAALRQGGDLDGAVEAWTKAVELKPDYDFALFNLGLTLLAKGERSRALPWFMKYRDLYGATLPPAERTRLEQLIEKCR